jgi:formate dehydrogenase subunit delta
MNDDTHVMSTTDRLVYMAHQIARNLASMGEERAVVAVADHLASFWDPRMKAQIIAIARDQPDRLTPLVAASVALLADGAPAHQTGATRFNAVDEAGHCDAG